MTRLKGGNQKWLTNMGNQLMQLESTGRLTQIGWVGWRKIVTPEGKHLAIIMTKSMTKDAKWAGRYDGKLYQDK